MATEFLMPKLGLTMEEGTITEWLVADGAEVAHGDAVLRIETDKTETDVEAAASGRLHLEGRVGETYGCGQRIGWFLAVGEDAPAQTAGPTAAPVATTPAPAAPVAAGAAPEIDAARSSPQPIRSGRVIASPYAKRLAAERHLDLRTVAGTGPGGRIVAADLDGIPAVAAASGIVAHVPGVRPPATTAARQLADLLGVDLAAVAPDQDGRISRESVAVYVRSLIARAANPAPAPAPAAAPTTTALPPALQSPSRVVKLTGMRGTIAKRMGESLRQMAQLTLHMDADMDAVVADRSDRKRTGAAPSYTDYVIAATARALVEHPIVNSQITDDGVALLPVVHVGMAVALDEGLIVPVITDTAGRDLASLSAESTRLAGGARAGTLGLPDLEGGTFSVSTLGMFGVDGFTPVINPPNTAILGVGRLRDDVVVRDGSVATVTRLTLSLTWDHRAFDGAPAADFCRTIVELLADPAALDRPAAGRVEG